MNAQPAFDRSVAPSPSVWVDPQTYIDRLPPRFHQPLTWRLFAWRQRRQEASDRAFDALFGTDTAGDVPLTSLGIAAEVAERGNNIYRPLWAPLLQRTIAALPIQFEQFSLVDYGSGKGKLLMLAAAFPFSEIIGVEYSSQLHAVAVENLALYRSETQQCRSVVAVEGDAVDFDAPAVPLVCTFFNPFDGATFSRVISRLEGSYLEIPRPIYVVFFQARSLRERQDVTTRLQASPLFSLWKRTTNSVVFRVGSTT